MASDQPSPQLASDFAPTQGSTGTTLRHYLTVLRRRKWLFIIAAIAVPVAAFVFSQSQPKRYEASADVLLNNRDLGGQLLGVEDSSLSFDAERQVETQADFAASPGVASIVLSTGAYAGQSVDSILASVEVVPSTSTNLLTIQARVANPSLAMRLASNYADAYVRYRQQVDSAAIVRARREVDRKLNQLRSTKLAKGALYASLIRSQQQLTTLETLQTSKATVIRRARSAVQVQPKKIRNILFGLLLGLVLGAGLVALREALDTRIRTPEDISRRLRMPQLGGLAAPPRQFQREDTLIMLEAPNQIEAEAFRVLATSLEFRLLDRDVKSIVVTSAIEREGKTTTASNLAIALARNGHRVALVDLDLRKPRLTRLFGLEASTGLTMAAISEQGARDAVHEILLTQTGDDGTAVSEVANEPPDDQESVSAGFRSLASDPRGRLDVVPSGPLPPVPGEFIASPRVRAFLDGLAANHDLLIIDTPPLLSVGDALTVLTGADAVIVVAKLHALRVGMLNEAHRLLQDVPAAQLGVVVTGLPDEAGSGYGYGYGYGSTSDGEDGEPKASTRIWRREKVRAGAR